MSYLMRPRAHFKGVFTANVPTANNDKVSMTIDTAKVQPLNPHNRTDEEFRLWMMQTKEVPGPGETTTTTWLNSYYNYFGDSGMSFTASMPSGEEISTVMTSSTLPDGTICGPEQDVFLTGRVELLGHPFFDDKPGTAKMVDLDPIGIYGTQVFSGRYRVVVDTGDEPLVMLDAKNPTRAYLYNLYFDRNIAPGPMGPQIGAGIWQMALPLDGLTFQLGGHKSPTLAALQKAAQAGRGLLVEYVTYYTVDAMSEEDLARKFKETNYKQAILNASSGFIVGTIGVWSSQDPLSSGPAGRFFYGTYPLTRPTSGQAFVPPQRDKVPQYAPRPSGAPPPYFLGPITAWVDTANRNVVLDFSSAIPEDTRASMPPIATDLRKVNYDSLTLTIACGGQEQTVAAIPYDQYDRAAYERTGGIIEVPYPRNLAGALADPQGILKLYGTVDGKYQPLAGEIAWAAVATDDRCLYLHVNDTVTYKMRPLWKGRPMPNEPLALTISQYTFTAKEGDKPSSQLVTKTMVKLSEKAYIVEQPPNQTYTTDADGYFTLSVKGLCPGAAALRYQAPGDTFDPNQGMGSYAYFGFVSYNMFRVLPNDSYDHLPDEKITWDLIYHEVIRYFYLIYPAMFKLLDFRNEETARRNLSLIRSFIGKRNWDSTTYMPVSRDLSDGKRKLLQRWCALNE